MRYFANSLFIKKFRSIHNQSIDFGEKVTVISGHNGVGKSNIMSLVSSNFGISNNKIYSGNFQPQFHEYFTITEEENYSDYETFLKVLPNDSSDNIIQRRQSYKNDTDKNRGIRIIPRASNHFTPESTISEEQKKIKDTYNIGSSARIPVPTIFVSLTRLFPVGETPISTINMRSDNKLFNNGSIGKYIEWYNSVLKNSISKDAYAQKFNKETINKDSLFVELDNSSAKTQSVGQDNLGSIITALVEFYNLKTDLAERYTGGLLCIDEIDASLHPSAQLNLLNLLINLSEDLELQIILTTHSLTILKEIIKLQKNNQKDFRLNYIVDPLNPNVTKVTSYRHLKGDLLDSQYRINPKVKIYCEDEETEFLLNELIRSYYELYPTTPRLPEYEILPVHLGETQLKKLVEIDNHFKDVLVVLDGDAKTQSQKLLYKYIREANPENGIADFKLEFPIVCLPTFLAPESYMYYIIHKLTNLEAYRSFWNGLADSENTIHYTLSRVQQDIINTVTVNQTTKNNNLKNNELSEKMKKFISETSAFSNYYLKTENSDELEVFFISLSQTLNQLALKQKAQYGQD